MAQDDNEQDYQDPILTPGNLKKIVQNLPGKIKSEHTDYDYYQDTNILENELNEFFNYTEVAVQLQEYRRLYEKEYKQTTPIKHSVESLLDKLENSNQDIRIQACQCLVYLSIHTTTDAKKNEIIENNQLLLSCGVFNIIFQKLQLSIKKYQTTSDQLGTCTEIDLCLTILYLLLETQRLNENKLTKPNDELISSIPNLIEILFSSIAKTREKISPQFPVKKALLLLWKSILFVSGGLDAIKAQILKQRKSSGLDDSSDIVTKCTPEEYFLFHNEMLQKYPGYHPPDFPIDVISPLTISSSEALTKAMGYSKATEKVDLLYQTLFPPKSSNSNNNNSMKKHHHLLQEYYFPETAAVALPLQHSGSDVPKSIQEASDVFINNMYVSLGSYQMIQEKSKAIHKWQLNAIPKNEKETTIDKIYLAILPHLQSFIVVILKLLLMSVTSGKQQQLETGEPITLEYLEYIDIIRNKEILSKAISGLLLVFLKWTKSSHILKFEYMSQLLVDSGCLLLVLKMIGLQEVSELVKAQSDVPYYTFFDYNIYRTSVPEPSNESPTNWRNMCWVINLLRLLQLLTKHKTHRTMLMVQYKSVAILKRVLKISHPVLEHYVLKLLKNQVPYLGRKWRSQNMKIISSIYLNCRTVLKDDWVSKAEVDDDEEYEKMQEKVMRILVQIYHHEKFGLPLPVHDELDSLEDPIGPGYNGWIDYDLHKAIDLDLDDDNDESDSIIESSKYYGYDVTPAPSVVSDQPTFTPEELSTEINKLYINELNSEFKSNIPIKPEIDQWSSTPLPKKKLTPLPRYNGGGEMSYLRPTYKMNDDEQDMEVLQDEVITRLMEVEEKVTEKWFRDTFNEKHDKFHYKMLDYEDDALLFEEEDDDYSSSS